MAGKGIMGFMGISLISGWGKEEVNKKLGTFREFISYKTMLCTREVFSKFGHPVQSSYIDLLGYNFIIF